MGTSFRGVAKLRVAQGEALGEIEAPENVKGEMARYGMHPALLDACVQVAASALGVGQADDRGDG